jgi:hypothetical protein
MAALLKAAAEGKRVDTGFLKRVLRRRVSKIKRKSPFFLETQKIPSAPRESEDPLQKPTKPLSESSRMKSP